MSEETTEPQGQAGAASSEYPAEGSVQVGEETDPTDDGQSLAETETVEEGGLEGSSSQDPAEG